MLESGSGLARVASLPCRLRRGASRSEPPMKFEEFDLTDLRDELECGLGLLLGHGNDDRGCSFLIFCKPCGCALLRTPYMNHVYTPSEELPLPIHTMGPLMPDRDPNGEASKRSEKRRAGERHSDTLERISDKMVETAGINVRRSNPTAI